MNVPWKKPYITNNEENYTNLRSQGYSAARCSMQGIVQYKGFFTVIVVYSVMNPYLLLKDMD